MIRGYSDHAANERTFLAWVRTGIAVIAFGFVIESTRRPSSACAIGRLSASWSIFRTDWRSAWDDGRGRVHENRRLWVRLREKGGKPHPMPCHHNLKEYLTGYFSSTSASISLSRKAGT
jgi:hypothetical protein